MVTVLSGALSLVGTSQRIAAELEVARVNAGGGLAGRTIELVTRDSKGQPQEAALIARTLVGQDGCEILIDGELSAGALAIQHVVRELGVLCLHTASEAPSLTADPKLRAPTAFRSARQTVHDSIVGSQYAAAIASQKQWRRWATCAPNDNDGHEASSLFFAFFKHFKPDVEIVKQTWPTLGQPDFTAIIASLLHAKPNALFGLQFAEDLKAFIDQARVYGLFESVPMFNPNLGDEAVLNAVRSVPPGLHAGSRYLESLPATPANQAWGEAYRNKTNQYPTNWSWQNATAWMLLEAAAKKAGSLEPAKLAGELTGLTIDCPFGIDGTITMRDDHTIVGYAIGWGRTVLQAPYIVDIKKGDWAQIFQLESAWKQTMKYT